MEELVLQTEFSDLPGTQIDEYTWLTHSWMPFGLIVICGNTRRDGQVFSQMPGATCTHGTDLPSAYYLIFFISASTVFTTSGGSATKPKSVAIF